MRFNFVTSIVIVGLTCMMLTSQAACDRRSPAEPASGEGQAVIIPDTPELWYEFVVITDVSVSDEKNGLAPPGGVQSWTESWTRSLRELRKGYRENPDKYVEYIIEARSAAGLPDLPKGTQSTMTQSRYEVAEAYTGLRDQVLQITPEAIGLEEVDRSTVFAVLMELGYPQAVATLVAVADGTVSLYFSNGGGFIGSGEHEPVRKVSDEFIALAQACLSEANATDTYPLPGEDRVRGYFVTRAGVYTFEASEDDLGYERHPCSPLFHKGHELIAQIREHSPE